MSQVKTRWLRLGFLLTAAVLLAVEGVEWTWVPEPAVVAGALGALGSWGWKGAA